MLLPGDPAPAFQCASSVNSKFQFDTAAGRYVVIPVLNEERFPQLLPTPATSRCRTSAELARFSTEHS